MIRHSFIPWCGCVMLNVEHTRAHSGYYAAMSGLQTFELMCYIIAFICLLAEALHLSQNSRVTLGWLGLAVWVLVPLVQLVHDVSH
jgi:hypothetical protein